MSTPPRSAMRPSGLSAVLASAAPATPLLAGSLRRHHAHTDAPTLFPCPTWCSRDQDHPFNDIDVPGRWVRRDTAEVSAKVCVEVLEDADHRYTASVWVSEELGQLSAAGALQLAADLYGRGAGRADRWLNGGHPGPLASPIPAAPSGRLAPCARRGCGVSAEPSSGRPQRQSSSGTSPGTPNGSGRVEIQKSVITRPSVRPRRQQAGFHLSASQLGDHHDRDPSVPGAA
jgi:hypothetical protein